MNLHEFHQFFPCPLYLPEVWENSKSSLVDICGEKHRKRRRQVGLGGAETQAPCDPDVSWGLMGRGACQLPLWCPQDGEHGGQPPGAH